MSTIATNRTTATIETNETAANSSVLHLLVMSPEASTSIVLPDSGSVMIGRSSTCAIRIDDPSASREHARLYIESFGQSIRLYVEDAGSGNGTRVQDRRVPARQKVEIAPGDAVVVGDTVLMVLRQMTSEGPRRLWSHENFERLTAVQCVSAASTGKLFALARLRFDQEAARTAVVPKLIQSLTHRHIFAAYGPRDYEILFVDADQIDIESAVENLLESFKRSGLPCRATVAWYPRDGRSSDALFARAHDRLRREGSLHIHRNAAAPMQLVREMALRAASYSINVLLLGETGVGKDVLGRLIHDMSPRARGPFVAINCAGLSEPLLESELFGYEKGAFTGALGPKVGLLESGNTGTIFLDEIGEMPLSMQARLLRVLETREVLPVGAVRPRAIDVRFVAATNRNLEEATAKGGFRRDLFYRLNGITLTLPPLRERTNEIPELASTIVSNASHDLGREHVPTISAETMDILLQYAWPGNIRELRNVLERALVLCDEREIEVRHLPLDRLLNAAVVDDALLGGQTPPGDNSPVENGTARERQQVIDALEVFSFNKVRAAHFLGIPSAVLLEKLRTLGINEQACESARDEVSELAVDSHRVRRRDERTRSAVRDSDYRRIIEALDRCAGNQTRAAQHLGISRGTLLKRLDRFGIARPMKGVR